MDVFCCILLVSGDRFSLIWSKSVVFTSPRRSTPTSGLTLLAWKTRKNNSWGCSLQEYGRREQPSLPQTRFLLSITNLPSEKRFAHRRKRGYIKANALKIQQLNSLKLPNKQTNKKNNLSSHSSPNPPSHVISSQSPTISDDHPRRTPGGPPAGFRTLPRFLSQFKIKMAAAVFLNLWILQMLHVEIVLKTKQPEAETSLVYGVFIRVIRKERELNERREKKKRKRTFEFVESIGRKDQLNIHRLSS